tara:strand:+ start:12344 stop:13165 length:822 start_codon:yes stop_codon:yes gene_type:complete
LSELSKRILVAVPAAAIFIWLTWLGGWYFKGMVILISMFIQHEIIKIMDHAHSPVDYLFPYTVALWVLLSNQIPFAFEIGLVIFVLFIALQVFNRSEHNISELSSTLFAGLYAPLGMLSLILVNDFGSNITGFILTMLTICMVWGSDILAYFGGKTFGKHPLAPAISPKKTWEGFFSGYVGSAIGAGLFIVAIPYSTPLTELQLLPMAILVATFGPLGDLLESKLKRAANLKDSGSILPGHGGFFDRFDAVILASPVVYVYLRILEELNYVAF